MTEFSLTRRSFIVAGLASCAFAGSAHAAYPDKPVRWIVGYPPGGATDAIARLIGRPMSTSLAQPIIVDNRPGAGSSVGASALAASPKDGYTVASADNGTLIINPVVYRKLQYDPDRDFRPVGLYAGINLLLCVRTDSGIRTGAEYLEKAGSATQPLLYASPGIGTPLHLAMERLARDAKVPLKHVAYKGMAPALNDLLAGVVDSIVIDYTTAGPAIKGGTIRPLAVFSEARLPVLPDVPTIAEQGLPGFAAGAWHGLIVPNGTSDEVVSRLSDGLATALTDPLVKTRYAELGLDMPASDPETFRRRWDEDKALWQPLIRSLDIKLHG
ncbi:tripartite tricarboxylate transporter substrate binding protein [Aureimonas sp. Leaf324]|uniref:Bug family tripartite tricarboxylate transporter substrate binding protein n=1 Tax=Aureimonas sp. Leaf324 TaxID=1736336 RepID=UPI0006F9886D|nr:tripartite tricarboxylate transporter substrate binding protein [Aureimonas sp. Leaf324]KQQ86249.1 ABC transporter substrate-binding protein [Aureimonas sp. Leaf324]